MPDRPDAGPRETGSAALPAPAPRLAFQIPAFAAVGASGVVVDAAVTYFSA